jgi:hypothetical protein
MKPAMQVVKPATNELDYNPTGFGVTPCAIQASATEAGATENFPANQVTANNFNAIDTRISF